MKSNIQIAKIIMIIIYSLTHCR